MTRDEILQAIENMTVLELSELVKAMEEKFGVSAAAPVAVAVAAPGAAAAEAEEEQTSFDVILKSFGDKKINVIKVVREITGARLTEAKEMVDNVPSPIKEGASKDEAEEIIAKWKRPGRSRTQIVVGKNKTATSHGGSPCVFHCPKSPIAVQDCLTTKNPCDIIG